MRRPAVTLRSHPRLLVALAALTLAAPAGAQQAAPGLPEDPRAPRFAEVERGLFTGFETGVIVLFRTPTDDRAKYPFAGAGGGRATGLVVGTHLGYDVSSWLAASLFALGANASAGASYGAFGLIATGADLRATVLTRRDRNDVERFRSFVHARAGYLVTRPTGLLGSTDLLLAAGPGVEYATRLRHFAVGLAADVLWLARAGTPGVSIAPSVRYTF
jgi:hypothetical protein